MIGYSCTGLKYGPLTTLSTLEIEIKQTYNNCSKFIPLLTDYIHKHLNSPNKYKKNSYL